MSLNRKFLGAVPVLMVEDVDRSISYYTHRLQFRLAGRIKDELAWLQLAGDDEKDSPNAAVNIFLQSQSLSVHIWRQHSNAIAVRRPDKTRGRGPKAGWTSPAPTGAWYSASPG